MTDVLPNGYLTILEAADLLSRSMYAGVPDLPIVTRLRKEGLHVRDGLARKTAIVEIWKAVDERNASSDGNWWPTSSHT
jgi:hypothetical protein